MWVTKLLITPEKKGIFAQKQPNLAFLVNLGQAMQAYSMPCCGSVGGCGARAVSCKTPIYFIIRGEILAKHSRSDPTDFKDSRKRKWVGGPAQLWAGKALTSPSVAPQDRIPGPQLPPVITPQRTFSKSKYDLK